MKTDKAFYPIDTKSVSMSLNNNNSKVLFLGEDYMVARKEDNQWLLLNGNNAWTDIGIEVRQGAKNINLQQIFIPFLMTTSLDIIGCIRK